MTGNVLRVAAKASLKYLIFPSIFVIGMTGCKTASQDASATLSASGDVQKMKDLTDPKNSLTSNVPRDYLSDVPTSFPATEMLDPMKYQVAVVKASTRTPTVPVRLAAKTVLETMRKNRDAFSQGVPGDLNHVPTGAGGLLPTAADMSNAGVVNMNSASDLYSSSPQDPGLKSRCIAYGIPHYSDIQTHYYCQIPSVWRGCHRLLLFSYQYHPKSDQSKISGLRRWATNTCLIEDEAEFDKEFASMFTFSLAELAGESFAAGSYSDAKKLRKYFKAMYETQNVTNDQGEKVNIFDYIMESQTYAFDWNDQNQVVNTFYGEMMPASQGVWDPSDQAMCNKWRQARKEDDSNSNYCLVNTPQISPIHAIGR